MQQNGAAEGRKAGEAEIAEGGVCPGRTAGEDPAGKSGAARKIPEKILRAALYDKRLQNVSS